MFLGRSIINWIILVVIAICVFVLAKWVIPLIFGAVGVAMPDQISTVLALLIALGVVWGGYASWRGPAGPA